MRCKGKKSTIINTGVSVDWQPGLTTGRSRKVFFVYKDVQFRTFCIAAENVNQPLVSVTVYILVLKNVLIFTEFLHIPFSSIKFPSIN